MILGRDDVDPNQPDNKGRTPLTCAAENGHPGVMALLQPPTTATAPPKPEERLHSFQFFFSNIVLVAYAPASQWLQLRHRPIFRCRRLPALTPPNLFLPLSHCPMVISNLASEVSLLRKRSSNFLPSLVKRVTYNENAHICPDLPHRVGS